MLDKVLDIIDKSGCGAVVLPVMWAVPFVFLFANLAMMLHYATLWKYPHLLEKEDKKEGAS